MVDNGTFQLGTLQNWSASNVTVVTNPPPFTDTFAAQFAGGAVTAVLSQQIKFGLSDSFQFFMAIAKDGAAVSPHINIQVVFLHADEQLLSSTLNLNIPAGAPVFGISDYGYVYHLATALDATILGGADLPFSNNGPLVGVTHTAGTTTVIIPAAGDYQIACSVTLTTGIEAQIAIAVNGDVDPSTPITAVVGTGPLSEEAILSLAAGDSITLRNNSLVAATLARAPSISAQLNINRLS